MLLMGLLVVGWVQEILAHWHDLINEELIVLIVQETNDHVHPTRKKHQNQFQGAPVDSDDGKAKLTLATSNLIGS